MDIVLGVWQSKAIGHSVCGLGLCAIALLLCVGVWVSRARHPDRVCAKAPGERACAVLVCRQGKGIVCGKSNVWYWCVDVWIEQGTGREYVPRHPERACAVFGVCRGRGWCGWVLVCVESPG